ALPATRPLEQLHASPPSVDHLNGVRRAARRAGAGRRRIPVTRDVVAADLAAVDVVVIEAEADDVRDRDPRGRGGAGTTCARGPGSVSGEAIIAIWIRTTLISHGPQRYCDGPIDSPQRVGSLRTPRQVVLHGEGVVIPVDSARVNLDLVADRDR